MSVSPKASSGGLERCCFVPGVLLLCLRTSAGRPGCCVPHGQQQRARGRHAAGSKGLLQRAPWERGLGEADPDPLTFRSHCWLTQVRPAHARDRGQQGSRVGLLVCVSLARRASHTNLWHPVLAASWKLLQWETGEASTRLSDCSQVPGRRWHKSTATGGQPAPANEGKPVPDPS
jgi:hypothetical protein